MDANCFLRLTHFSLESFRPYILRSFTPEFLVTFVMNMYHESQSEQPYLRFHNKYMCFKT